MLRGYASPPLKRIALWGFVLDGVLIVLGHTVGLSLVVQMTTLPVLSVWGATRRGA
ncbi:MAG: hypothetical protein ABJF88_06165 [Rhodothermales bacterium]